MKSFPLLRTLSLFLPIIILVAAAIVVASVYRYPLVIDDPFITYRYARNLVAGNGFVFNPGERVLSTTAPLFALVLAAFGFFRFDIPTVGLVLSVAGYAASAILLFLLGRIYKRNAGFFAGVFILTAPALVLTLGLETGFYLALALAALYAYARARITLSFALLALLTLTRPDGALLAFILAAHFIFQRSNLSTFKLAPISLIRTCKPFAVYILLLAPFFLAAWWWFGAPFPSTLNAKIVQAQSGLWQPFAFGFANWFGTFARGNPLVVVCALIGLVAAWREGRPALLLALWGSLHIVAYSLLGVAFYAWYVAPFVVALFAFAAWGIESGAHWLIVISRSVLSAVEGCDEKSSASPMRFLAPLEMTITLLLTAALLFANVQQLRASGMDKPDAKAEIYRAVAEWIRTNTAPTATIDALEVGLLGYYDERRTTDFVGLVEPARLPYLRTQYLSDGVRFESADYVIAIPPDTWLALDPWFLAAYEPAQKFSAPNFYSGKPLIVYRRVDVNTPLGAFVPRAVNFEHGVRLDGFALGAKIRAGELLPVMLQLRSSEILSHAYKITLQLLDTNERVVAQSDTFFPLRWNRDDQPFRDLHSLRLPSALAPGDYQLLLAFYYAPTDDRLSVLDANGNATDDRIILSSLKIDAP